MLTVARPGDEAGYTLVELLLAVVLLGIIMASIVGSLFAMLAVRAQTETGLAVSRDRQFFSNRFSEDVADALQVQTGTQTVCGSTIATVVLLSSTDYDPGSTTAVPVRTAWSYDPTTASLLRTSCRGTGAAVRSTVARNVSGAPTTSASCSTAVALSSLAPPPVVSMSVPQTGGDPLRICARRRTA